MGVLGRAEAKGINGINTLDKSTVVVFKQLHGRHGSLKHSKNFAEKKQFLTETSKKIKK